MDLETKNLITLSLPNNIYPALYGFARYGISVYGDGSGATTLETKNLITLTLETK